MRLKLLSITILSFLANVAMAQPANDSCSDAERLCGAQVLSGTTTAATTNSTEDDLYCSIPSATVWYKFTTNSNGGNATISFSNLNFNADPTYGQSIEAMIYSTTTPCDQNNYVPYSLCTTGSTDFTIVPAAALNPNSTYYLMVNGVNTGVGVTNSAECDFDITISGEAMDSLYPTASISAFDTILCQGDVVAVETIIANCSDTASFDWYYNNSLFVSNSTGEFNTADLSESGYLKLIMNCGNLCVYRDTTDSIYFDVTTISADAGPDKFIAEGDFVTLEGNGDGAPTWTPAGTLTDAFVFEPSAFPENTTTYFLTVTNGSCEATDSVNVFVGEVVSIFSAFTPNNDDINDKWVIKNSSEYPNMEVTVYDRSGQRVFNTTGYSTPDKWWDGTYKGKPLPVSTYFYVVDLKIGDDGIFKGQVNIIR
ncbi:gliding motility-associated C-terminal domain-containing protein [Paracrocinitomix mangrovi]|uniref:gliding motility-associated C-terminal domain-containing protein n=1 Tax=Paracrocinitomix mangrovi TaxID=2862509 RepID=UPI001C8EF265|nr:gliding motility-associated C-terminal domain-containing protein [Paracrocinitomix mangrovi]UKN00522.1 gliding motility-associated C-terminal domain-containing protein [Paracrocinitomix mangrovi]